MIKATAACLALTLAGCGVTATGNAPAQPRALLWGASTPACVLFCTITVSAVDSEGSTAIGSGDISLSRATSAATTSTASPSLSKANTTGDAAPAYVPPSE